MAHSSVPQASPREPCEPLEPPEPREPREPPEPREPREPCEPPEPREPPAGIEGLLKEVRCVKQLPQILNQLTARVGRVDALMAELDALKCSYGVEEDARENAVTLWQFCRAKAEFGLRFKLHWGYPFGRLHCSAVVLSGDVDDAWLQERHPHPHSVNRALSMTGYRCVASFNDDLRYMAIQFHLFHI